MRGIREQIDFGVKCRLGFIMEDAPLAFCAQCVQKLGYAFNARSCEVHTRANLNVAMHQKILDGCLDVLDARIFYERYGSLEVCPFRAGEVLDQYVSKAVRAVRMVDQRDHSQCCILFPAPIQSESGVVGDGGAVDLGWHFCDAGRDE